MKRRERKMRRERKGESEQVKGEVEGKLAPAVWICHHRRIYKLALNKYQFRFYISQILKRIYSIPMNINFFNFVAVVKLYTKWK